MPRPSSSTWQPPSASSVTPMRRAVARHRLVDRVVDDLPDQVVQPGEAGRADVHARPFADRIEAFEDLDRVGVVGRRGPGLIGVRPPRTAAAAGTSASGTSVVSLDTRTSCRVWLDSIIVGHPGCVELRVAGAILGRQRRNASNAADRVASGDSSYQRGVSEPGSTGATRILDRAARRRQVARSAAVVRRLRAGDADLDAFDVDPGDLVQAGE